MDDTASSTGLALAMARCLEDHKGEDTVVLDVAESAGWTDYFVITTARSVVHAIGLVHESTVFLQGKGVKPRVSRKRVGENGWQLLDCGDFVVHIMVKESREFYDLEKLWFKGVPLDYSSKSS
jgi:ribosome-associated protein